jgi:hypothetical protein
MHGGELSANGKWFVGRVSELAANRDVPDRVFRIRDGQGDARVTFDVPDLLESRDAVDQDVLAVGIDPGLSQLG